MAREFDGTDDTCQFNPGNAAGVHAYGTVAVLFKRPAASGGSWRCPIYTGTGSTSNWGLCLDINTGNVMWFGLGTGESTGSTALNTTNWYLLLAVKPNGSGQTVRFHIRSHNGTSWSSWTHANGSGTVNNAASPSVSTIYIGSFAGFDFFNGRIAAAAIYEQWAPNDAAVEAIDWVAGIQEWVDAAASSTGAWVICPGQGATSVAIQDLIGTGHETSSNVGTVADDPPGFDVNIDSGDIFLESAVNSVSSFTAAMQVDKELQGDISSESSFLADLRVGKLLSASASSTSSLVAEIEVAYELASGINSESSFAAELQVEKHLASSIQSVTEFEADLQGVVLLSALISSTSNFEAALAGLGNLLEASILSETSATAELRVEKELEADISSTSNFRARLDLGFVSPFNPLFQVIIWGRNRWFDPQFKEGSVASGNP